MNNLKKQIKFYLLEEILHYLHGFVQLVLGMLGSIQSIVGHCYGSVAIEASTVVLALIVTATSTTARAVSTRSITWCSTYLENIK